LVFCLGEGKAEKGCPEIFAGKKYSVFLNAGIPQWNPF
jgi:hypothetical protein